MGNMFDFIKEKLNVYSLKGANFSWFLVYFHMTSAGHFPSEHIVYYRYLICYGQNPRSAHPQKCLGKTRTSYDTIGG